MPWEDESKKFIEYVNAVLTSKVCMWPIFLSTFLFNSDSLLHKLYFDKYAIFPSYVMLCRMFEISLKKHHVSQ